MGAYEDAYNLRQLELTVRRRLRVYDLPADAREGCARCPPLGSALLSKPDRQQANTLRSECIQQPPLTPWDPGQPDTMGVALRVQEGEQVYDYAWFSCMNALDPQSCVFATTTRVRCNTAC